MSGGGLSKASQSLLVVLMLTHLATLEVTTTHRSSGSGVSTTRDKTTLMPSSPARSQRLGTEHSVLQSLTRHTAAVHGLLGLHRRCLGQGLTRNHRHLHTVLHRLTSTTRTSLGMTSSD